MDPIVLVPGLLCTDALYAPQIAAFEADGHTVSVADHRSDDTIPGIAERLLRDAPERFVLAGLSMGGYVAMEVMRQAPHRVTRLALLDTAARPDTPEQTANRKRQIRLAEAGRLDEVATALFPLFVHEDRENDPGLRNAVLTMARATGAEAFARQQTAIMNRIDSRPHLAAISCPTLVLVGEGDRLTPPDRAREMHELVPGSRLEIIPGGGHLPTLETPGATTAALRAFLRG
ncbi:MAG: alpha/beta hydrolase [Stappia sp.]|uniref:alpha/beta fold hydrolase n=1 Tax=Stappia sp. TaxID=1870903 RepID=UPI000C48CEF2|nr:alpha/beta fold hydrolase [Stappia sp.]MAA98479.1 alpha/beta hydrolase [Stappia sp.]MBM21319.1 alpha/beta hydrolase [Stappia sp.]|tara:strand:- start:133 stop:828 length:696 start_codon:yes stop_codon:yes gene_type:complete